MSLATLWFSVLSSAQIAPSTQASTPVQNHLKQVVESHTQAEAELQQGTALTRRGSFVEAIPYLLAARGKVANSYAADFNLALCYIATSQFKNAIEILSTLRGGARDSADVENLLAQAYVGNDQAEEALSVLQKAAALTPENEKLFLFVADACMGRQQYALGLKVVDLGLHNLPQSARLHYQRGAFLSSLDEFDRAKEDFELASTLAPNTDIAYLSAAHHALLAGNISESVRVARDGIKHGFANHLLLTILGEALIRSGISPGQPEFSEAQSSLEKSVAEQPNDAGAQIALGKLYLMSDRLEDAISHLEKAKQLESGKPSVYASLAKAYQRRGNSQQAEEALAMLAKLNQAQADRISAAPGDRKASYTGGAQQELK